MTDIERGESWPLLGDEGRSWRPSWSPDGTHLAFYADHRGAVQLWSWQPAVGCGRSPCPTRRSSPRLRGWTRHAGVPTAPACTCFCFRSNGGQRQPAHRRHPPARRTGQPWMCWCHRHHRPKTRRQRANEASQRLCDVGIVDVRTGSTERLSTEFGPMGVYPSLDGHWLAVVGQSSQPSLARYQFTRPLYLAPAMGGTSRLVAAGLDYDGTGRHDPAWSPDSQHLAYVRAGQLWLAPASGGEPRQSTARC